MHLFETLQNVEALEDGRYNKYQLAFMKQQALLQLSVRGHYDQSVNEARVEGSLNTQISIS